MNIYVVERNRIRSRFNSDAQYFGLSCLGAGQPALEIARAKLIVLMENGVENAWLSFSYSINREIEGSYHTEQVNLETLRDPSLMFQLFTNSSAYALAEERVQRLAAQGKTCNHSPTAQSMTQVSIIVPAAELRRAGVEIESPENLGGQMQDLMHRAQTVLSNPNFGGHARKTAEQWKKRGDPKVFPNYIN